ncbi:effector protein, partial ['Opuntia sp.' phytoplasma]
NLNNKQVIAAPNEEFFGNMRIVNVTVSNIDILKNHKTFKQYFDFAISEPCYNGTVATSAIMWTIKNPHHNLLGVYFDDGTRDDEDDKYTLEDLKKMGNGASNMYIFWQYEQK